MCLLFIAETYAEAVEKLPRFEEEGHAFSVEEDVTASEKEKAAEESVRRQYLKGQSTALKQMMLVRAVGSHVDSKQPPAISDESEEGIFP